MSARRTVWILLVVVVVLAAGLTWSVSRQVQAPRLLRRPVTARTVTIDAQTFDDARSVNLSLAKAQATSLTAPVSGVLTSSSCTVGRVLRDGQSPWTVDGTPLITLHLQHPPYRDLVLGNRGVDVTDMQARLRQVVDPTLPVTGTMNWSTLNAFNLLRRRLTLSPQSLIPLAGLVWLPESDYRVGSCPALLGSRLADGASLATATPTFSRVAVTRWPTDILSGGRRLVVGAVSVDLGSRRGVRGPRAVRRLVRTPEARLSIATSGKVPLVGSLVLRKPVQIFTIPAGSLGGTAADCVQLEDGTVLGVRVASSSLGRALVTIPGQTSALTIRTSPGQITC